jgi:ferredoxin
VKDFRHLAAAVGLCRKKLPSFLYAYVQGQLGLIPEVREEACTGCSECANMCPAQAIGLHQETARVDEKKCIHCLCCHEVCRFRAIRLKQLPLGKVFRTANEIYQKTVAAIRKIF